MLTWKFSLWEPQNCLSLDVQKVDSVDTGATYVAATSVILGFKNLFDSLDLVSSATSIAAQWNFTSVSMTVFLAQVWRPLSFQQVFGRRDCWATREFSKMLFNPTIDSSAVGFNANSNLFWAHSDQHLGKHPYFEGIVVLSRLCWERLCMSTLQELQDKVGKIRSSKSCWKMLKATVSQGRRPTEAKWNPGSISQRACHVACLWWEVNKHGWLWQVWRMRCLLTIFSEMLKEHPA